MSSEPREHDEPGERGVIIPESNVTNLMLKEEVIEAVKQGAFHIWAVKTIDEGIEILTGTPAGNRQEDGSYEVSTVNDRVNRRLKQMAEMLLDFGKDREEKSKQEKEREEIDEEMDKVKAEKEEVDKEGKE